MENINQPEYEEDSLRRFRQTRCLPWRWQRCGEQVQSFKLTVSTVFFSLSYLVITTDLHAFLPSLPYNCLSGFFNLNPVHVYLHPGGNFTQDKIHSPHSNGANN